MIDNIRSFYKNNRVTSGVIITLVTILLILTIVRLVLSPGIIYATNSWLEKQGITSDIEDIEINLLDGTVALKNAHWNKTDNNHFNIGLVELHWQWKPLSEKTIEITKVVLDKLKVNIEQYTDEIIISGLNIALSSNDQKSIKPDEKADAEAKPWAAALKEIVFTNLDICYLKHTDTLINADEGNKYLDYCVNIGKISWGGSISYATDKTLLQSGDIPLSSTGDFILSDFSVTDNRLGKILLSTASNALSNVVISGLNLINIETIQLDQLSVLQRNDSLHNETAGFKQLRISNIKLSNLNSVSIDDITLAAPVAYLVKNMADGYEHQQWIPEQPAATTDNKTTENDNDNNASPFSLSLNSLTINDADMCYLDTVDSLAESLNYCLTFNAMNWAGKIYVETNPSKTKNLALAINGDIKLSQPDIHNNALNRNLISLQSVELKNLNITDINRVSLQQFNIEKLAALQRSDKKDDNTLAFEKLSVRNISYENNGASIDTVNLDGLASTVSKNKSGGWEHDKWLPGNNQSEEQKADQKKNKSSLAKEKSPPLMISLNKLNINSREAIQFIDNTTSPEMTVGLQQLDFDFSKLYSAKPEENSLFNLHASTARHGAIDLKGTVTPLAEKISLNADGALKGFDLRFASPATQKAIGHIIKSGQLDAVLKLRAVKGELDSNIALSLYHFNIKSQSKADTEKLDEKFGMPLNQTLVLLRDKDDSIHLDIPITGDITNPNFNPMDAIVKATSKAATVTLITFYTPYGLIYAGGNLAFNLATALNFDPVEFSPGSAEITDSNKTQLDSLTKLLEEKPQVHLTLCGIANIADAIKLYPQLEKANKDKTLTLTKEQNAALEDLASQRQTNSKNYLVEKHQIEHSRLILCAPEYQPESDAISGVEINI